MPEVAICIAALAVDDDDGMLNFFMGIRKWVCSIDSATTSIGI